MMITTLLSRALLFAAIIRNMADAKNDSLRSTFKENEALQIESLVLENRLRQTNGSLRRGGHEYRQLQPPSSLVYWNQMESLTSAVIPSKIGDDMQEYTFLGGIFPVFDPEIETTTGRFGNGLNHINNYGYSPGYDMASSRNHEFLFYKPNVSLARGTLEYWWQAGTSSANQRHSLMTSTVSHPDNRYVNNDDRYASGIDIVWNGWNYWGSFGKRFSAALNSKTTGENIIINGPSWTTFSEGQWLHIALSWDKDEIPGQQGKTIILYINGTEYVSSTETWTSADDIPFLTVGTFPNTIQWWWAASYYSHAAGLYDNIKVYDFAKTDFTDRGDEFAGYEPEKLLEEMVSQMVTAGVLEEGQETALMKSIEGAMNKVEGGELKPAENKIGAFVNKVEALMNSERLAPEIGQELIDMANEILIAYFP